MIEHYQSSSALNYKTIFTNRINHTLVEEIVYQSLIVIPSINGAHLLERMLPTLNVPPSIIVVLDQGSIDHTEKVCKNFGVNLIQLGHPHTYTEACNIGADIAKERNCDFLFVSNNDITFKTDVVHELLSEMINDPMLGIVAPAQMLIDPKAGLKKIAYRVCWDLENLSFYHDFQSPAMGVKRIEADFCELTFALIRMSVISKIRFLDNNYGFYHEDADFGYRLRQAGYTCAYLPCSQIEHWISSTLFVGKNDIKQCYIEKNKKIFAGKFLGLYLSYHDHKSEAHSSWNIINKNLHSYIKRFGLLNAEYPELIFSHPGTQPFDYLYTVWETMRLPAHWIKYKNSYKMILTPSKWNFTVMSQSGFQNVHYVPLGVETDFFNPWGPKIPLDECKTFMWFSQNQYRKGLDVVLKAWSIFYPRRTNSKLILIGRGILDIMPRKPALYHQWNNIIIGDYLKEGISVYELLSSLNEEFLAMMYRSVDFTICTSRSEGFGLTIAESMACGTPSIFGNFGGTKDFSFDGALMFDGKITPANYSDKNFYNVGDWWEPNIEQLIKLLYQSYDMSDHDYRYLSHKGLNLIRTNFSWRKTCFSTRSALLSVQEQCFPIQTNTKAIPFINANTRLPIRSKIAWSLRYSASFTHGFADSTHYFADNVEKNGWKSVNVILVALRKFVVRLLKRIVFKGQHLSVKKRVTVLTRSNIARKLRHYASFTYYLADKVEKDGWRSIKVLFGAFIKFCIQFFKLVSRQVLRTNQPQLRKKEGVLFIGYAEGNLGFGEAFRNNLIAAAAADLRFAIYPFQRGIETRLIGPFMPDNYDTKHIYDINIIEVTTDQVSNVFKSIDKQIYADSYNILRTYWELPTAPISWGPMLVDIDELWVPNVFVKNAFLSIFSKPIIVIPPAIDVKIGPYPDREFYQLEADRFYFLFSFDFFSFPQRKNPLAVIAAFRQAFSLKEEKVGLIIKTIGAIDHYPEIRLSIMNEMKVDSRILQIDRTLDRVEMLGLIKAADCYISLHRSEGFGLGMAEAMSLGRPVIGTNFSGNVDFLNEETGFPVPYRLRSLDHGEYIFIDRQLWAEPDIEEASKIMRMVYQQTNLRESKAKAGQSFILEKYNPKKIGNMIKMRLSEIKNSTKN